MADSDRLRGFSYVGELTVTHALKTTLMTHLDWGLIDRGGFYSVNVPTSGAYGGDWHVLRPVSTPYYADGRVWEGKRKNWVWEQNLGEVQPIAISGVYVNGAFLPHSGGYHINYPNGQVVFDTAIDTSSVVTIEYSHKWITVTDAREIPFLRGIETNSFRVDDTYFLVGSGDNIELAESRVQLPAVGVEVVVDRDYTPYALGGYGKYARTDVIYHVVAEDDNAVNHLIDIIGAQDDKTIFMFSTQRMANLNATPLDYRGEISSGTLTYPELVKPTGDGGFRYTDGVSQGKVRLYNARASSGQWVSSNIYTGSIRLSTEVILPKN